MTDCHGTSHPNLGTKQPPFHDPRERGCQKLGQGAALTRHSCSAMREPQLGRSEQPGTEPSGAFPLTRLVPRLG